LFSTGNLTGSEVTTAQSTEGKMLRLILAAIWIQLAL